MQESYLSSLSGTEISLVSSAVDAGNFQPGELSTNSFSSFGRFFDSWLELSCTICDGFENLITSSSNAAPIPKRFQHKALTTSNQQTTKVTKVLDNKLFFLNY